VDNPAVTTYRQALEYEITDSWPRGNERWRFWTGPEVPEDLTQLRRPDPRKVLIGEESRLEFERELAEWIEARITWLKGSDRE
jgi:hypothetical protein